MTAPATVTKHRVRWYVYVGEGAEKHLIPRESTMRGFWTYEAKCTCGWETHTGGATHSYIRLEIWHHKWSEGLA